MFLCTEMSLPLALLHPLLQLLTPAPGFVPPLWQLCQMFLSGLLDSDSHMISDSVQLALPGCTGLTGRTLSPPVRWHSFLGYFHPGLCSEVETLGMSWLFIRVLIFLKFWTRSLLAMDLHLLLSLLWLFLPCLFSFPFLLIFVSSENIQHRFKMVCDLKGTKVWWESKLI